MTILTLLFPLLGALPGPPSDPVGTAEPVQDAGVRIVGEARDGSLRDLGSSAPTVTDLRELGVVWLRFEGRAIQSGGAASADPRRADLELVGGDRLRGTVAGGDGEDLSIELLGGVVLPLPISDFHSVVFPERIPEGLGSPVEAPPELDRLYRRIGAALDPVDGTVEGFSDEGVAFDSLRVGRRVYPWGEVAALFVEVLDEGSQATAGEGTPVIADLADGSRLRGRMRGLDPTALTLQVGARTEVRLPTSTLAEVVVDDGSLVFLSDLPLAQPEEGRGDPWATASGDSLGLWNHRRDRAVSGGSLRAGGRTWPRGIGAHAPSRLTFDLGGAWAQLRGRVAVDDSVVPLPAEGSVVFRILLDGEVAWESPVLAGGAAPVAFPPLDVTGKASLVLEADMADGLHMGDRANWLGLVLVAPPGEEEGAGEGD